MGPVAPSRLRSSWVLRAAFGVPLFVLACLAPESLWASTGELPVLQEGLETSVVGWVLLPSSFLSLLLIAHSARERGLAATVLFVGAIFPYLFVRELFSIDSVMYEVQTSSPRLGPVPIVPIVGWFFAIYCSLALAETTLRNFSSKHFGSTFLTALLACLYTWMIAELVETTGQNLGWWVATSGGIEAFPQKQYGAQQFAPAWVMTMQFFMLPYLFLVRAFRMNLTETRRQWKWDPVPIALVLLLLWAAFDGDLVGNPSALLEAPIVSRIVVFVFDSLGTVGCLAVSALLLVTTPFHRMWTPLILLFLASTVLTGWLILLLGPLLVPVALSAISLGVAIPTLRSIRYRPHSEIDCRS